MPSPKHAPNKFHPCVICYSNYRTQIDALLDKKTDEHFIAEKYGGAFPGMENLEGGFFRMVCRHEAHYKVGRKYFLNLLDPQDSPFKGKNLTVEDLAKGLLELGNRQVEYYKENPQESLKKVRMSDVMGAQKLLLDKQRVKVEESALKLQMAKFFGGIYTREAIEPEEVRNDTGRDRFLPKNTE